MLIRGLFYEDGPAPGKDIMIPNLTYNQICMSIGLDPQTTTLLEQFPWDNKPYIVLSLDEIEPTAAFHEIDDGFGFTKKLGGPLLFLRSELTDDDYSSLTDDDIKFISGLVHNEVLE